MIIVYWVLIVVGLLFMAAAWRRAVTRGGVLPTLMIWFAGAFILAFGIYEVAEQALS